MSDMIAGQYNRAIQALRRRQLRPDLPVEHADTVPLPTGYVVGLDLGQSQDYTAVVVNERHEATRTTQQRLHQFASPHHTSQRRIVHHRFTWLHRFPLGTPYPDIIEGVQRILAQMPTRSRTPDLVVDATGVGRPVLDSMRAKGLRPIGVTITGGADPIRKAWDDWRVPKRMLASALQVVLQGERLKIAAELALTPLLIRELAAFKVKITLAGNETFEAWREQDHDDLVLAAGMAVWGAEEQGAPLAPVSWSMGR